MNQDKIWDFFQNEGITAFAGSTPRLHQISQMIKADNATVLNIGVGNGYLEQILSSRGLPIYSLDPSEKTVSKIRAELTLSTDRAKVGYSQEIPFDDSFFDVVVMSEVIEHLSNDVLHASLAEVRRVLKPGGRLIGTVPAEEDLSSNDVICPECGCQFHRWGHHQSFSKSKLTATLTEFFERTEIERAYFGNFSILNWKGRIGYLLKKFNLFIGGAGSGENFLFVATKNAA